MPAWGGVTPGSLWSGRKSHQRKMLQVFLKWVSCSGCCIQRGRGQHRSQRGPHCQGTTTLTTKWGVQLCPKLLLSFAAKPSPQPAHHQRQSTSYPAYARQMPLKSEVLLHQSLSASTLQSCHFIPSSSFIIFHLLKMLGCSYVRSVPKLLQLGPSFSKLSVVTLIFALFPTCLSLFASPSPFLLHLLS